MQRASLPSVWPHRTCAPQQRTDERRLWISRGRRLSAVLRSGGVALPTRRRQRAPTPGASLCTLPQLLYGAEVASGAVKDGTHAPLPRPSASFARVWSSWGDDAVTVRSGGSGKTDGGDAS